MFLHKNFILSYCLVCFIGMLCMYSNSWKQLRPIFLALSPYTLNFSCLCSMFARTEAKQRRRLKCLYLAQRNILIRYPLYDDYSTISKKHPYRNSPMLHPFLLKITIFCELFEVEHVFILRSYYFYNYSIISNN